MNGVPLASRLEGKHIGKWTIKEKRKKTASDNSGFWSTCYKAVDDDGNLGFFKAYNYVYAFSGNASSPDVLKQMTENYTYERDLLEFCKENHMKRVVSAIDSGQYRESQEIIPVPYLVFEIAQGNLNIVKALKNPNLAWKLRAFHGALVGLSQLHRAKIVHQDIKPSNILIFGNNISKISDLGTATQLGNESNWAKNANEHGGDWRYAPIELFYGYCSLDWDTRRLGCDLFMMGGLLTYMITDSNFLSLMFSKIPENYRWDKFGGKFAQALPVILKAYYDTLDEIKPLIPVEIRDDVIQVIAELSYPEPEKRGNPQNLSIVKHKPFSLQRYISVIDRVAKRAGWLK